MLIWVASLATWQFPNSSEIKELVKVDYVILISNVMVP